MASLKTTPLIEFHREMEAKTAPIWGWTIPVNFPGGTVQEHLYTRSGCSIIDLACRPKFRIAGTNAAKFLAQHSGEALANLPVGEARTMYYYNADGGIVGAFRLNRMADQDFFLAADPGNRLTARDLASALPAGVEFNDLSEPLTTIGIFGPRTPEVLAACGVNGADLPQSGAKILEIDQLRVIVELAPETGDIGYELHFNAAYADQLWDLLLDQEIVHPAGWHSYESLCLEFGTRSCGRELRPEWQLDDLKQTSSTLPTYHVVGLVFSARTPPAPGSQICTESGQAVGEITSSGLAPTLGYGVALGVIKVQIDLRTGSKIQVAAGEQLQPGTIAKLPFVPVK